MNRTTRFLQLAREARQQSTMPIKLGAVLTRGNRVIKSGYNSSGAHSGCIGAWSRHAEINTTINVNAKGGILYVYREHGILRSPLLAKPCKFCQSWLQYIGVDTVVYTINEYPYFKGMKL